MINILLVGACGKMGHAVAASASLTEDVRIVAGVDVFADATAQFPIYPDFDSVKEAIDVVIDFSSPKVLPSLLAFCKKTGASAVLCTTGYSEADKQTILDASKTLALFQSANMSVGINLLSELCRRASSLLGSNFEVEIVEKHHNKKVDAPSGTALALAEEIASVREGSSFVYGRQGVTGKRTQAEIGIHAVRGGNIVGDHDVMFISDNEIITLSHRAESKAVFADGAVRAAKFIAGKPAGKYSMKDLISE